MEKTRFSISRRRGESGHGGEDVFLPSAVKGEVRLGSLNFDHAAWQQFVAGEAENLPALQAEADRVHREMTLACEEAKNQLLNVYVGGGSTATE